MIPLLIANPEGTIRRVRPRNLLRRARRAPLLVATLEGETEEVYPLGRSFLRRQASRAGKVVSAAVTAPAAIVSKVSPTAGRILNPIAQTRNAARGISRITRATARPVMQLSRGNVKGAFVDLGRAVTTTVTAPVTMTAGAVSKSLGQKVEGVIARNDPNALINRKIFEAVKAAVRPIVRKFAGEDDGTGIFGDDAAAAQAAADVSKMVASGASKKAMLRAARGKILAAAGTAGAAAGTSVAGPYGAPVGAALAPAAVDAVIEEIGNEKKTPAASAGTAAQAAALKSKIPAAALVGVAALGAFLLLRKKG